MKEKRRGKKKKRKIKNEKLNSSFNLGQRNKQLPVAI